MASRTRPIVMTGVALATAATVVAAVPAIVPADDVAVASSVPAPLALSTANYELTALYEITPQGMINAYWTGWGGFLKSDDPYYPTTSRVSLNGPSGLLYYLIDCAATPGTKCTGDSVQLTAWNLDNYYFEAGGLPAVINVAINQYFGQKSLPGQLANVIFKDGVSATANTQLVTALTALQPTFNLGPVKVGGGILASLYFTGSTPGEKPSFSYGSSGLSAVLSYIASSISAALTPPGTTTKAAAVSAAVSEAVSEAPPSDAISSEETTTAAQTATEAAPKADAIQTHTEATSTQSSTAATTPAKTTKAESTKADTLPADAADVTKTELGKSELDKTEIEMSLADATAGTKTDSAPKSTSATKPAKPESPLAKLAKSISDALTGKKADKSESGSSSDSAGSGGSGSPGGSTTS